MDGDNPNRSAEDFNQNFSAIFGEGNVGESHHDNFTEQQQQQQWNQYFDQSDQPTWNTPFGQMLSPLQNTVPVDFGVYPDFLQQQQQSSQYSQWFGAGGMQNAQYGQFESGMQYYAQADSTNLAAYMVPLLLTMDIFTCTPPNPYRRLPRVDDFLKRYILTFVDRDQILSTEFDNAKKVINEGVEKQTGKKIEPRLLKNIWAALKRDQQKLASNTHKNN